MDTNICGELLQVWCDKLLELQVKDIENPRLKGGIMCPSCARIHGRCFDAIYPFMYLADVNQDDRYKKAAIQLFDWAENTVSQPDGSYVNDTNSSWKGTTVFSVIQLIETLKYHGHLLDEKTRKRWTERIRKAADFLFGFREFEVCNVNYRITNSLAMYLCGELFDDLKYFARAEELSKSAQEYISDNGILYGEGRPVDGFSPKGCRAVDIGYGIEESLPSFMQYAVLSGNEDVKKTVLKALKSQLKFFLEDGGIDNSFGTRNYKWTYWGSRTSDGCALGYLLAADQVPEFGVAAYKNLELLKRCTHDGFLYGGPQLYELGEPPCVHHAFSHAKVLAGILDAGLDKRLQDGVLAPSKSASVDYVEETDTYLVSFPQYRATVTGYDWEYLNLPEGHASGGTLSLLWQKDVGLILCAGMDQYSMKEVNNMQLPTQERHECMTPRLEYQSNGIIYSSMYDYECRITSQKEDERALITVCGTLRDKARKSLEGKNGSYKIEYRFEKNRVMVKAESELNAEFVLPVVSLQREQTKADEHRLQIQKNKTELSLAATIGTLQYPYGTKRIYSLVPGLAGLKTVIQPKNGIAEFYLSFVEENR